MDHEINSQHGRTVEVLLDRLRRPALAECGGDATDDDAGFRFRIRTRRHQAHLHRSRTIGTCRRSLARSPRGGSLESPPGPCRCPPGIRCRRSAAVLSSIVEAVDGFSIDRCPDVSLVFDHNMFWRHSLGVGILPRRSPRSQAGRSLEARSLQACFTTSGTSHFTRWSPRRSLRVKSPGMQCCSVDLIAPDPSESMAERLEEGSLETGVSPPALVDAVWLVDQPSASSRTVRTPVWSRSSPSPTRSWLATRSRSSGMDHALR